MSLTDTVSQRIVVAASCVIFLILIKVQVMSHGLRLGLLAVAILMACIEKLAAIMNLVSVERDWVSDPKITRVCTAHSQ
jgi:iron-regulated transporter 1